MNKFFKKEKGFSLVEIIIYLGIFSFISIFTINSLIISMSAFNATHTNHILLESGLSSIDRISREIRQANSIDIGSSYLGSSPGVLQLNTKDSSGISTTIKITKEGSVLNLYSPANTLIAPLLDSDVAIDSLIFTRIDTTAGEAVRVEMTLRDTKSKTIKTENFYNTIILRGSY